MPNHKAYKKTRANALRWRHKKVEHFERLLKREQKEFLLAAQRTLDLMAKYPANSMIYFERWLKDMEEYEKTIVLLEAKIRAAGLCPVRVPQLISRTAQVALL